LVEIPLDSAKEYPQAVLAAIYGYALVQGRRTQLVLVVLIVAVLVWLVAMLVSGDDGVSLTPGEPKIVSVSELEEFAHDADRDVYWAGERIDTRYELSETEGGKVFVRYLPVEAGGGSEYLTVGSYPVEDAVAALRRAAREDDRTELARSDEGAVILLDRDSPDNVHLAYPGEDVQIEVFSPVDGEALRIAARDRVEPVP
jgi:hypothetical protein